MINDYRSEPVVSAYAPLEVDGFNWVILSEKDEAEAFLPANNFNRRIFIQTIIIVLAVTILSMLLAGFFVNPIENL